MQIGTELLSFESAEDLKLDNFNDIDALVENVKDHVQLDTDADNFDGIKILIKAGTQLAVGQSVATLNQDVTVEVTSDDMTVREDILSICAPWLTLVKTTRRLYWVRFRCSMNWLGR